MQVKSLQWKRGTRITLFILMLSVIGITKANANNDNHKEDEAVRAYYSFSAVCPTGQTLYYKITNSTLHYVKLTHPYSQNDNPWQSFTEPTGVIELPETVTNPNDNIVYTITAVGDYTFNKCHGLSGSLIIPNTIEQIGEMAFGNCDHFTSLVLNSSLEKIGKSAFRGCENLTGSLVIPSSVTEVGLGAFAGCSGFNGTLTLPEGLQKIGARAFEECSNFTGSLIIPNSVTSLGQYAFYNCNGFNGDLKLSDNITILNPGVFQDCSGFTGDLVIPKSITSISNEALRNCNGFSAIYICANSVPVKGTENNSFTGIRKNIPIYIPSCLVDSYNTEWSAFQFTNYKGRSIFNTEGDWSNSENWACGDVPSDPSTNVVVAANCDLNESTNIVSLTLLKWYTLSVMPETVMHSNTITNKGTAASLIIQDGGQLYHNNSNVLATVMKPITPYSEDQDDGWYLISSPLAGNVNMSSVANLLSNEYDLYYYDEPTAYWMNQENEANQFTQLTSGKGYLYANSENVTLGYAGSLKVGNSNLSVSLVFTEGSNLPGFNLVGNPYAHNVTAYSTSNVAEQGCYRMNPAMNELIVSEISENSPLKPAEGFFVLATGENASITFNGQTRSEVKRTGSINLDLSENGVTTDRLIVKRSEEDRDFAKLSLKDNRTKLFASKDKQELAIVVCNEDEQPVNFKTVKNGNYTINVTINDIEVSYLHLIDNLTGNDIDLLATPSYSFDARITDYASRFRLVFEPNEGQGTTNESFAFISEGAFVITNEGIATLQVVDMTGRVLSTETINGNFTKPITLSNGVYVLRLFDGDNTKTQKIVVR